MLISPVTYDVIVIGGGHAGCEAALAAARSGCHTILLTHNLDTIGFMSCNPAIGGLAKGQLVKEIDALGGEMGRNTDATAIQFRVLNTKKGSAVRSSRAQVDRQAYRLRMKSVLERQRKLELKQAPVNRIFLENGRVRGVETSWGEQFLSHTVIVTTGTFLRGLIHIGLSQFPAGRMGDPPSVELSQCLKDLGFEMGRLKTGTTPRLDGKTIDFSQLDCQNGNNPPLPFSFSTREITQPQVPCYITYTNQTTHEIIRSGLDRSPLFTGIIKGTGARYCPSIEDKVVRFSDKDRHQIFLEPEGYNTSEYYPNGLATSLPLDIQIRMLRTIKGLEQVEIMRPGYAIEYDYINPTQLLPTLETKSIQNLFCAGQINGTSGYEEAAAQGIMAGINAALKVQGKPPFTLDRSEAYIGVLVDDLITRGTKEPYRMFTSRAEYRLVLREDNADLRLRDKGYQLGLVSEDDYARYQEKKKTIEQERERLKMVKINPHKMVNDTLCSLGSNPIKNATTLEELLRRPELSYEDISVFDPNHPEVLPTVAQEIEIQVKYQGYIERQEEQIARFKKMERMKIPPTLDFSSIPNLSTEVREKLSKIQPVSLGQASRISGITPAALSILMIYLKKLGHLEMRGT
ncbi:MAG: tRNA uridine-5-carboxymethylaminomethyl(34) synthesis enzyme MnmG [Proteobacteria bacterium]|nr:tRNA uridine-5-carboxymethylaminomethyl(34) synthesis enzyme MnmG [Pseudomonadota bacterium]